MAVFLDEILLHIFGYLNGPTLTKCSWVCKQWRSIAKTPSLWRRLVLLRWPSQKFLYEKVSLSCVNWMNTYQELSLRGNYTADYMKYFICCCVSGDELTEIELRESMFLHMAGTMMKWEVPDVFEQEDEFNTSGFNKNFELFFDTHDLKWTFIDKRRGYNEDWFSGKMKASTKPARYIRPYQVIPSCMVMFRWLCLFRAYATEETGLTFYRIWRYRLKHRETGVHFEVFDWKAAMSCTLSNGSPTSVAFREDALELLTLLTHPHFLMHPMGVSTFKELFLSPPKLLSSRCNSASSSLSSCGLSSPRSPLRSISNQFSFERKDTKARRIIASSTTDSDDESEGGFDTGYVSNCEYFISSNHWDIEEQHKIQAEVAGMWTVVNNNYVPHLFVNYDVNSNMWVFHDCMPTFPELWIQGGVTFDANYDSLRGHGFGVEPIPSCLALYRLVCLMNINARVYVSMEDASIWALHLIHNTTRAVLHLKDLNGWFDASVTLTEDMQNQLREASDRNTELETVQWCEVSTPVPAPDNISEYVASDEESDDDLDGQEAEDFYCVTPTHSDEERSSVSSAGSEVDSDDLEDQLWFSGMHPQFLGEEEEEEEKEASFWKRSSGMQDFEFAESTSTFWQSLDVPVYQTLSNSSDVENQGGAWGMALTTENCDSFQNAGPLEDAKGIGYPPSDSGKNSQLQPPNSHYSDSEGSEVPSGESTAVSTLKQFKHDVTVLLNLLMDEKFAHPYGTIAGAVA